MAFQKRHGAFPSSQLTIGIINRDSGIDLYTPGEISRLYTRIGIANSVGYNICFCWKSRSGKIVHINDKEFDEEDLECWLEGFLPETYYQDLALYTNKKSPFKIKDLPFELDIRDYGYAMDVFVFLKNKGESEDVSNDINRIIVLHNEIASVENDKRPLQAVHNWSITNLDDVKIKVYLDAASPEVLKKNC